VSTLVGWFENHAYLLVFVTVALELVGVPFPSETILIGAGAAAAVFWVDALVSAAEQHAAHYHAPAAAAAGPWTPKVLSPAQNEAVIALAEIIIPKTETPGATDARVNEFIDGVLAEASEDNRKKFLDGLAWLDTHTTEAHGAPFTKLTHEQQVAVLTALSQLSPDASPVPPAHERS